MTKISNSGEAVNEWVKHHPLTRKIRNNPKRMAHYLVDFADWVIFKYNEKHV